MNCRHCGSELSLSFVDLGSAPPSNAYLTEQTLHTLEKWYPLRVLLCKNCWLVQTEDFASRDELFDDDYAYFSSFSTTWLDHAKRYVTDMIARFGIDNNCHVMEIGANDGYLLQYVKANDIPCTGVEPTACTAAEARSKGIPIIQEFFDLQLADELAAQGLQADLAIVNNVLAHVPDINSFVSGIFRILKPKGIAVFEFPYLLKLIKENQLDTIYHEHFSYFSFITVKSIFSQNGLQVFDVEEHNTHGGSLRVFAQRFDSGCHAISSSVEEKLKIESWLGIDSTEFYVGFQEKANKVKNDLVEFLISVYRSKKKVCAYGAAAKGNTLLNYAGIRPDLLPYVVDKNPAKQGKYMPGSRIPILNESHLKTDMPNFVILLPWNLKDELINQLGYIRQWGGKFVVAVSKLELL